MVIVGVLAALVYVLSSSKPVEPSAEIPETPKPPEPVKAATAGEEVQFEPIPDAELERLAMQAAEEPTAPAAPETSDVDDWKDVLADATSVIRRKSARPPMDIRTGAGILANAGIQFRVAPSRDSLLGIHALQVHEADFDRALEVLQAAGPKS